MPGAVRGDSNGSLVVSLIYLIPDMKNDETDPEGLMPHFCAVSVSKDGNSHSLAGFHFDDTAILNCNRAKTVSDYAHAAQGQDTPVVHKCMHRILDMPPYHRCGELTIPPQSLGN